MPTGQSGTVLQFIRRFAAAQQTTVPPDPDLLGQFLTQPKGPAFAALVRRHGPMVLHLCRRILQNEHEAEDAFQATFLVLSRKAAGLRPHESLGG